MLDKANSSCLEHRLGLIAHELSPSLLTLQLSERLALLTREAFKKLALVSASCSGKLSSDRHLSGVGFMVRNSIVYKLETSSVCHFDHIISMHLLRYLHEVSGVVSRTQTVFDHKQQYERFSTCPGSKGPKPWASPHGGERTPAEALNYLLRAGVVEHSNCATPAVVRPQPID